MSASPPNILICFGDQERCVQVEPGFAVPNQDRLAERGVRFNHAFTPCPQCSPARASLQTGLYPSQHGVAGNTSWHSLGRYLSPERWTLGKGFRDAGYTTAYFGKWHLSPLPTGDPRQLAPYGYSYLDGAKDEEACQNACAWIRERDERPWMAWVSFFSPHDIYGFKYRQDDITARATVRAPSNLADSLDNKPAIQRRFRDEDAHGTMGKTLDEEGWRRYLTFYAELIEGVDQKLGRILDALETTGELERTLVVFLSDHGDMAGGHGLPHKGPFMYDELLHVPLILSYPSAFAGGMTCDRPVSLIDLPATLCDIAGIPPPPGSLGSSLRNAADPAAEWPDTVFAEFHSHLHWECPIRTVRSAAWKYSEYLLTGEKELYDLRSDPGELNNLAGAPVHAATEANLAAWLLAWREQTHDPYLTGDRDPKAREAPLNKKPQRTWI